VLRVNCYRLPTDEPVPVIMCAHPYGKDRLPTRRGRCTSYSFQYRMLRQTGPVTFSTLTSWEAPDPDWWVGQGYAVINCDLRRACTSEGVAEILSEQEGEDIYDMIEWAAANRGAARSVFSVSPTWPSPNRVPRHFSRRASRPSALGKCPPREAADSRRGGPRR
jgi:hypothetical protein